MRRNRNFNQNRSVKKASFSGKPPSKKPKPAARINSANKKELKSPVNGASIKDISKCVHNGGKDGKSFG